MTDERETNCRHDCHNDVTRDALKSFCLHEELDTAYKLILSGFGDLQEIDSVNNFYHLPHQLLASGIERLMKCYICLVFEARGGRFPDNNHIRKLGHSLSRLSKTICNEYFSENDIPALKEDYSFLMNDHLLKEIIRILSEFGRLARYYNLDIITGSKNSPINPIDEWRVMERSIENGASNSNTETVECFYRDYYPRIYSRIISKIERFVRAIARQFTLGGHGGRLRQFSNNFTSFRNLTDRELGTIDYRRSVKILQKKKETWKKRTEWRIKRSKWHTKKIFRDQFSGEWPFRADSVIIECRNSLFCIVNIEEYDFALNGSAKSRFDYPFPHDAGIAILGKSIGPFIDMAFSLSKTSADGGK